MRARLAKLQVFQTSMKRGAEKEEVMFVASRIMVKEEIKEEAEEQPSCQNAQGIARSF